MMMVARALIAVLILAAASVEASAQKVNKDCTFKGRKLWGKVMVVTSSPDIKIQVVSSFPDLKVMHVNSFPDSCGKWQMVTSFPDLKIEFVNSFPDLKIMHVNSFPGLP